MSETWAAGETIRSQSGEETLAPQTQSLPTLSVDLRNLTPAPQGRTDLEVRGVIGEGGMGRVLLARQHSLSREVAVKTAKPDANESARLAILEEGAITGRLEHPAIVPVHVLGLDAAGWPALVMKRIEGVSWDVLLGDPAHPGWEGWEGDASNRLAGHLQILISVCNALHFAHSREVVHRDVKPQNVLIGRFGDVYVADWGVATARGSTHTTLCGTPAFMAPEMVGGGVVDERTDVYLLGATLHAVLTGKHRHPGATLAEVLSHARASPFFDYPPEVPTELASLANQACHLEPGQRPPSARAFRDEVLSYLRHRDARALTEQAQRRVAELEVLEAKAPGDLESRARVERLLSEAQFGLEQALAQWPQNVAAKTSLARVEAMLEARRQRALALEAEARAHNPATGAGWRTASLAMVACLAMLAAVVATHVRANPTPLQLVSFPAATLGVILVGVAVFRKQVLTTRFNQQVLACLVVGLGYMVLGRVLGLFVDIDSNSHFARDAFVEAAVMTVCAAAFLRWAWLIAGTFAIAGVWCTLVPSASMDVFTGATVVTTVLATLASAVELRNRTRP